MATYNTIDEILAEANPYGFISGEVTVPLIDIVHLDLEGFYDRLAELLVDDIRLNEIDFDVIGSSGDNIVMRVTGDASAIIDERMMEAR